MTRSLEEATAWVYRGVWGVLTKWFRVPHLPPALPVGPGEQLQSFRPSGGFLRYLKFKFWLALVLFDGIVFVVWLAAIAASPGLALLFGPIALIVAIVPDIIAYVAIHLRYDTTWYVLTNRSLRMRRGIWEIHETTITFENVQNVSIESGPLERFFGIANVIVDTAGGGSSAKDARGQAAANYHQGRIEGIDNASEIRTLVLSRVRQSRSAGLGDDASLATTGWSEKHIAALREIRDSLLNATRPG